MNVYASDVLNEINIEYINNVLINIEAEETTVKEAIETLKDDLANIDNNDRLDTIADACDGFIKSLKGE